MQLIIGLLLEKSRTTCFGRLEGHYIVKVEVDKRRLVEVDCWYKASTYLPVILKTERINERGCSGSSTTRLKIRLVDQDLGLPDHPWSQASGKFQEMLVDNLRWKMLKQVQHDKLDSLTVTESLTL